MTTIEQSTNQPFLPEDDLLWRQLKTIPAFRAILRAVESRFYFAVDLPGPVLDLGCGDGHFAQMTFDHKLDVGLDPWWNPLKKAYRSDAYHAVLQGMGNEMPFPDKTFASAFSNSVLEHIPDIQPVLNETGRVLQQNGRFLITMPSQYFTQELGGAQLLEKLSMEGMADRYRNFFNTISRHEHTDGPDVWAERLAQAGFTIERWQYYFSTEALHALEVGHAQGVPSALMHFLTGTWVVAPWESSLSLTDKWVRPFYEEEAAADKGAYLLIVAQKKADGPIPVTLPPAQPFTVAELETAVAAKLSPPPEPPVEEDDVPEPGIETAAATTAATAAATKIDPPSSELHQATAAPAPQPIDETSSFKFDLIAAGLIGLTILLALIGQMTISQNPADPWSGMRWFLFSFIALFLLAWRVDIVNLKSPDWKRSSFRLENIPPIRWLYFLGLIVVFFAFRQANAANAWPAWSTIGLWLVGIGIAYYSLHENFLPTATAHEQTHTSIKGLLLTGTALFITALLIRLVSLSNHPWILNGLESSVGLEVQNIVSGAFHNPFSTGWQTVPTLPLFLMALPLGVMGPSAAAIRLLSPFIGALTVLATFLIGTKLWRIEVGLIAAILLTGSHYHIHYSRLGLPIIWDALLMLLALGFLSIAWEESKSGNVRRAAWLWAGITIGLNAYAYTPSRAMPLILIILLLGAVFFQRQVMRTQLTNIVAAFAIALIVALPQMLYYNSHPGIYWERFNELSLLGQQSEWLTQQALLTGQSEAGVLWQQIKNALLSFNVSLDNSPAFGTGQPLLSTGLALFFVLGVMMACLRIKQHKYSLSLLWLLILVLVGGVLLIESPSSHRLVAALPIICLLSAAAMVDIGEAVMRLYKSDEDTTEKGRQLLLPVLLIIATLIALNEMAFYFGSYRYAHTFADRNTEIAQGVADYLNTLDGEVTSAYFYGPPNMYISFPTIPFLSEAFFANENLFDVPPEGETAVLPETASPSLTFIVLPERAHEISMIQSAYPGGVQNTVTGYHANPLFYTYEVTP